MLEDLAALPGEDGQIDGNAGPRVMLDEQLVGSVAHLQGFGFGAQPAGVFGRCRLGLPQRLHGGGVHVAVPVELGLRCVQPLAQRADLALQL